MTWTSPAMQRHSALSHYLAGLGLEYGAGPHAVPEALSFQGRTMSVDPWERAILQHSLNNAEDRSKPWAPLLAEGLAFQFKCLARSRSSERATASGPGDLDAETEASILDAAVGLALLDEMQRAVDQLVVAGEIAEAKKLTASRNRIAQCVTQIKDLLGGEAYARAENKSQAMVAPPGAPYVSSSTGPESEFAGPAPIRSRRRRQEERADPDQRLKIWLGVLGVASLAWLGLFVPGLLRSEAPLLEPTSFPEVPGVASVLARPPSLFVSIDDATWDALSERGRRELVSQIGAVALQSGYNGAHLTRAGNRQPIGRWLKAGGTELIE